MSVRNHTINSDSRALLLDQIKRKGRVPIDRLVTETGMGKTTIREHLAQLERDGLIRREFVRSGAGRPALFLALTDKGHNLFPTMEDGMFRDLLGYIKARGDREILRSFFEQFWEKRLECIRGELETLRDAGKDTRNNQLRIVLQFLEKEGFMPEIEFDDDGAFTVKECNCPYKSVIRETHLPCRLEIRFYEKLFDAEVRRTNFIPNGDHACTYKIRPHDRDSGTSRDPDG